MARYRGTFSVAASYEPLTATPFDARQLVEYKSDLTDPKTWRQENGDIWIYVGMYVAVAADPVEENNGLYLLKNKVYTLESSWEKQATKREIDSLQEQIDNLVVGAGSLDVTLETQEDLPEQGDSNTTYYIKEDASIWRWDNEHVAYISYGGSQSGDMPDLDEIINVIHGGNAHGTD